MKLKVAVLALTIFFLLGFVSLAASNESQDRLEECGAVMKEILSMKEGIPQDLLDKAECVVVMPSVKKFALGIGGSYGRGALVCRSGPNYAGPWGAPAMFRLEGASVGFQIGGSSTDFVLLVMNPKGAKSILTSKVKLGADASAAAGPKGRTASAETDIAMSAEVLTYSRAKGVFAGVSLEGSTLRDDHEANKDVYGQELSATAIILEGKAEVPVYGEALVEQLRSISPKNLSN